MIRLRPYEDRSIPCRYSDSCFKCPKKDCVASASRAAYYNMLPGDKERLVAR